MTINATVCICSYLRMSFCTNSQELLWLNISVPKRVLHKGVHCQQTLLWETALGSPAQQLHGKSRRHLCQKPGQGIDSRTPHTLPPPSTRSDPKPPFWGDPGARPGAHLSRPGIWRGQCTELCRPGEEPETLQQVQHLPLATNTFNANSGMALL